MGEHGEEPGHHAHCGGRRQVECEGGDPDQHADHEAVGEDEERGRAGSPGGPHEHIADPSPAIGGELLQRRLADLGPVGHQEHREDRPDEVGRRRERGGADHLVATADAVLEALDGIGDPIDEVQVLGELAHPVVARLDALGGLGRRLLQPGDGAVEVVEHQVGDAEHRAAGDEEAQQHRRHPTDVLGQPVDHRIEEHGSDDRGGRPTERAVGGDEDPHREDAQHERGDDGEAGRRREANHAPRHGPLRRCHRWLR